MEVSKRFAFTRSLIERGEPSPEGRRFWVELMTWARRVAAQVLGAFPAVFFDQPIEAGLYDHRGARYSKLLACPTSIHVGLRFAAMLEAHCRVGPFRQGSGRTAGGESKSGRG